MKRFGNLLWGLVFIAVGTIFALNALEITNINIFFEGWWTLFIIVPCFIGFVKGPKRLGDFIGLVIGIALLLCVRGYITFSIIRKLAIPFVLIVVGLTLIFKDFFYNKINEKIKQLNKSNLKEYAATFGENKINMENQVFDGAELTAVFGGVDMNLNGAIINGEQIINATAIFGGIDIKVPVNVNVKVKSTSIFGGVGNKVTNSKEENVPTIYVNAFCMFGGVDIK
ncbi:MAG: hypothetical protein J6A29_03175 [Clostridia bacterium]|nr:hypothetical protein [Clostridia bacterium]